MWRECRDPFANMIFTSVFFPTGLRLYLIIQMASCLFQGFRHDLNIEYQAPLCPLVKNSREMKLVRNAFKYFEELMIYFHKVNNMKHFFGGYCFTDHPL